jgi:hypothetical protein
MIYFYILLELSISRLESAVAAHSTVVRSNCEMGIIAIFKCGAQRSFAGPARATALNGLIRKIKKARNGSRTEKAKKTQREQRL